jgi:hypothetical protein
MRLAALILLLIFPCVLDAEPLRLLAWNVESIGSDPEVIAQQLKALSAWETPVEVLGPAALVDSQPGLPNAGLAPPGIPQANEVARRPLLEPNSYHIFGLSEVDPEDAARFAEAVGGDIGSVLSETGNQMRLLMLYRKNRLELMGSQEPQEYNGLRMNDVNLRHRSPLIAQFRDRVNGQEFFVVLTHLARGNANLRQDQAKALQRWVADQELPALAIGDFNFDYSFISQSGNAAFEEFLQGDHWKWVRPEPLVDTNWADRDNDGIDDYPDSCLDFVFVGGKAKSWIAWADVIVRDGDFPDDETTSDHRPVELTVDPLPAPDQLDELKRTRIATLQTLYNMALLRWQEGTLPLSEVFDAQQRLLAAQLDAAQNDGERAELIKGRIEQTLLYRATLRQQVAQGMVGTAELAEVEQQYLKLQIQLLEIRQ